jgi:D-lactate dehydrogenase
LSDPNLTQQRLNNHEHRFFFSCQPYEQSFLEAANQNHRHQLTFLPQTLSPETFSLAAGHQAICVFVNDWLDAPTLYRPYDP